MDNKAHAKRIQDELKKAGAGAIGRRTPESRELVKLIHHREHIGGVVYGVYPGAKGVSGLGAGGLGWLVATNQRVLFIDRKPLFATHDELTYDIVVGTTTLWAGLFVSVILHTRIHDYVLRFVNPKSARIFTDYVEARRLSGGTYDYATLRYTPDEGGEGLPSRPPPPQSSAKPPPPAPAPPAHQPRLAEVPDISAEGLAFLRTHELGVLSTVDRTGNVDGAVVYYYVDPSGLVYILTRTHTVKGRNVYAHGQVALTVFETGTEQTLQLRGFAEVEDNETIRNEAFAKLTNPHLYGNMILLPPIAKLHEGAFMIVRITPTQVRFHDYAAAAGEEAGGSD